MELFPHSHTTDHWFAKARGKAALVYQQSSRKKFSITGFSFLLSNFVFSHRNLTGVTTKATKRCSARMHTVKPHLSSQKPHLHVLVSVIIDEGPDIVTAVISLHLMLKKFQCWNFGEVFFCFVSFNI
jgi:hypothetical protein